MAASRVMGIVNVTPDSFSDGGLYLDPGAAVGHGRRLAAEGADLLDVGGESTRPGAAAVAAAALDAGAVWVNDVTALRGDPELAALCAERGCEVVLMHMLGSPRTMQDDPRYDDVVDDVRAFLAERIEAAVAAGIDERRILVDPGIGFGKTVDHNLELLRRLGELSELGRPIVVGASRKRFLGAITGREVDRRGGGTAAANVLALAAGADVFRVHDVAETRAALDAAEVILGRADWRAAVERRPAG